MIHLLNFSDNNPKSFKVNLFKSKKKDYLLSSLAVLILKILAIIWILIDERMIIIPKFNIGDDIDQLVTKVIIHEFSRCTLAFNSFAHSFPKNISEFKNQDTKTKLLRYNSYALFVQHLYEYFVACLKRSFHSTDNIDYKTIDKLLNFEVDKILRNRRDGIDGGWAPSWENHRSYYEDECPKDFASDFRQIRNSLSHADFKRIHGGDRITLTQFYKKYHKYAMLLYQSGREWWSLEENIELGDVTNFSTLIFQDD